MWGNIFNPDSRFFQGLGRAVDVVAFSLLWLAGMATVILFGPSSTALYDVMARCLRKGESGAYRRYFDTLKSSFKTACPTGMLTAALGVGLYFLHGWLFAGAAEGDSIRYVLYFFSGYSWPLSRARWPMCFPSSPDLNSTWVGCWPPASNWRWRICPPPFCWA